MQWRDVRINQSWRLFLIFDWQKGAFVGMESGRRKLINHDWEIYPHVKHLQGPRRGLPSHGLQIFDTHEDFHVDVDSYSLVPVCLSVIDWVLYIFLDYISHIATLRQVNLWMVMETSDEGQCYVQGHAKILNTLLAVCIL